MTTPIAGRTAKRTSRISRTRKRARSGELRNCRARRVSVVSESRGFTVSWQMRREFCSGQPKVFDAPDNASELIQVHWLCYITVGVEAISPRDVVFRLRSCKNDDGNPLQPIIGFDFGEQLAAIFAGQIQ